MPSGAVTLAVHREISESSLPATTREAGSLSGLPINGHLTLTQSVTSDVAACRGHCRAGQKASHPSSAVAF